MNRPSQKSRSEKLRILVPPVVAGSIGVTYGAVKMASAGEILKMVAEGYPLSGFLGMYAFQLALGAAVAICGLALGARAEWGRRGLVFGAAPAALFEIGRSLQASIGKSDGLLTSELPAILIYATMLIAASVLASSNASKTYVQQDLGSLL